MNCPDICRRLAAAMCALAVLVPAASALSAGRKLRFTTQEWEPYQYTRNGQITGVAVAAVRCAAEKLGIEADIAVLPWLRAQTMVAEGDADAFFAASRSPERDAFATLSDPIAPQVWRWYLPADSTADPATSGDLKIGVILGSAMEKYLAENKYTVASKVPTSSQLVRLLSSGRVDAVLANDLVMTEAMNNENIPQTAFKTIEHSSHPLGVYFSKTFLAASEGFLRRFNDAIAGCAK